MTKNVGKNVNREQILFRQEVFAARGVAHYGNVRLVTPVANWLILSCAAIVAALLIALLALGEISPKLRLSGVLAFKAPPAGPAPSHGDTLEAVLFVPASQIDTVQPGQHVNLTLHSFPAQKFGTRQAVIGRFETAPILPDDEGLQAATTRPAARGNSEAIFVLHASLDNPTLLIRGALLELKPGMKFDAEISQAARSIWSILFFKITERDRKLP